MRLNDTLTGILLLLFGIATVTYAQTFPPSPGQDIGPNLFPSLLGVGLVVCGLQLVRAGFKERGVRWVQFDEWVRRPRMVLNGVLVIADLIFYALAVDVIGFFITAFIFVSVLLLAFGVKRRWIPVLAVVVTLALHFIFYSLLRVPLPWGWLEGIAW
jgi:putative tricarboxylic transport membrane protein